MDQQDDQRRANRHVSRAQRNIQRRNMTVQRRNVVQYRVQQNIPGNVTITNNYYFDMNAVPSYPNPRASYPPAVPSSQPLPPIGYGPNQNEANAANLQVVYVAIPPITYVPPQATHIAIPLPHSPRPPGAHAFSQAPRILNGATPRNGNAVTPRFVHVGPPGSMNGAPSGIVRFPSPREEPVAPMPITSTNAYIVAPNGNFVTGPAPINNNVPTYFAIPSRVETITYAYSNASQRVVPPPSRVPNGARIIVVDNVPPVEEVHGLSITEVVSSTVDEELN